MFAVGKPSLRPRPSPSTTGPSRRKGAPRHLVAASTSPAATSERILLEETISPSTSTSGTTLVSNSSRDARSAGSPLARAPKRKFSPTETVSAPSVSTRIRPQNSSGGIVENSWSNGITSRSPTTFSRPPVRNALQRGGQLDEGTRVLERERADRGATQALAVGVPEVGDQAAHIGAG